MKHTSCARTEGSLEDVLLGKDGLCATMDGVLLEGIAALELATGSLSIEDRVWDVYVSIE